VTNGNYLIQIDSTSLAGVVTSVSKTATVNRNLSNIMVNIYNSAGELIRTLYSTVADSTGASMTDVNLSANIFRPTSAAPVTSGTPSQVNIVVNSSDGTAVTLTWDGTNNSGTDVTPGVYTVDCHWSEGSTNFQNITRSVIVIGGIVNTTVVARPNMLNSTNGMITTFDGTGVTNAYLIQVQIYTIAGQLLQTVVSPAGIPEVNWNAAGLASGIYIAVVDIQNAAGADIGVQRLKILVLH
jgi:flagellar hook assembly protein FlgD